MRPKRKYELTNETITYGTKTLYRIRALITSAYMCKGDLGGFVESEKNLSHDDNAWVSGNAWVFGDALVYGDALVSGNARVSDDASNF